MEILTTTGKREQGDITTCSISAIVLAGGEIHNYVPDPDDDFFNNFEDFVVDLDTLIIGEKCVIDYNHNDSEIIGACCNIRVDGGSLLADGVIVPFSAGDRAHEVAYKSQFVQYGVSPTLDFWESTREFLEEGVTENVNKKIVTGPVAIFRNVKLIGVSICPYPTDTETAVNQYKRTRKAFAMNEENKEVPQEATVKDAELLKYCEKFGVERGVEYYQSGLSIEEATDKDYEELKRKFNEANICEENEESKDEENEGELKASLDKLSQKILKMESVLDRNIKIVEKISGESSPVRGDYSADYDADSYASSYKKSYQKIQS